MAEQPFDPRTGEPPAQGRVWVFDRGIVRKTNLAAVRRRDGQYRVGTPRPAHRSVEHALLDGPWPQMREEVEPQLVPMPGDNS